MAAIDGQLRNDCDLLVRLRSWVQSSPAAPPFMGISTSPASPGARR